MKKNILFLLVVFLFIRVAAQEPAYDFQELRLNNVLTSPDHEFSSLYLFKDNLFLLPENKNPKDIGLYILSIADLSNQVNNKDLVAKPRGLKFKNLSALVKKIDKRGQWYDGLEALAVTDKEIFFSVETTEDTCYLIKGRIKENDIEMDPNFLIALLKPRRSNNGRTCNAGFEGMEFSGSDLLCFFEFNDIYTASVAVVNTISKEVSWKPLARLPFRLTDVTWTDNNKMMGINYFYAGGGCDTIYQPEKNSADYHLATDNGKFKNLCRLVELEQTQEGFNWKPVFNFPGPYHLFNWEGIAQFKDGFFLINDRYTDEKQASRLFVVKKR